MNEPISSFRFEISNQNVGSTEAQITFLTRRVIQLSYHLKTNSKDYSSQRGLKKMLGRRKRLLTYLARKDFKKYQMVLERLGIRGGKLRLTD